MLVGFGHSVLAMSGEESLAQVNREIEHPKLKNLEKAGLVIFLYSLLFTSLVSFFAVMIIPDKIRPDYFANLISGLAMDMVGPYTLKLIFQGFVVLVGVLILSGAVNTAIVGANGVLNRISEDGVHARPGSASRTQVRNLAYRIINLITSCSSSPSSPAAATSTCWPRSTPSASSGASPSRRWRCWCCASPSRSIVNSTFPATSKSAHWNSPSGWA